MTNSSRRKKVIAEKKSPTGAQNTRKEDENTQKPDGIGRTEVQARPDCKSRSANETKDPYEHLRTIVAIASLTISILALVASIFSARAANRSAMAAQENVAPLIMPASLLGIQKFPPSPPYIVGTNPRPKFVIQPGAEVRTIVEGSKLSQGDIDELKNGVRVGYFYGKISYDDVFHKTHCATFCLRIDSNLTDVSFCETYNNETDGYCEEQSKNK